MKRTLFLLTAGLLCLGLAPLDAFAAPPPTCSCAFCLENPDERCKRVPFGGTILCSSIIRDGIGLGRQAPPDAEADFLASLDETADPATPAPAEIENGERRATAQD